MSQKAYAGLMVTLLNREDGTERKITLYPAVRVELIHMHISESRESRRVFEPLDNMGSDVMGWREVSAAVPAPQEPTK